MTYQGYYRKDYKLTGKSSPSEGEKGGRGVANLKDTQAAPRDFDPLTRTKVPKNESDTRKSY